MRKFIMQYKKIASLVVLPLALFAAANTNAAILGATGTPSATGRTFNLEVTQGAMSLPDGATIVIWGYGEVGNVNNFGQSVQYPGPTLIVNQGDTVTVNLTNKLPTVTGGVGSALPMPVSVMFPGHSAFPIGAGGTDGLLARESLNGGDVVTYQFIAGEPGTYMYQSGTKPGLQIEMGMLGAIIVRPTGFRAGDPAALAPGENHSAYGAGTGTDFDHEYLFMLTEMDPAVHEEAGAGRAGSIQNYRAKPVYWFINGRAGLDTTDDGIPDRNYCPPPPPGSPPISCLADLYPVQPYGGMVRMLPGEKTLLRVIGAGRDLHPFHTHGANFSTVARDGRLFQSAPGMGADLAESDYTLTVEPGSTYDALFTWENVNLGWDIYGHKDDLDVPPLGDFPGPGDIDLNINGVIDITVLAPGESAADHLKPLPIVIPELAELALGAHYSASPFLGDMGSLPYNEGGFNVFGGMYFMWHSHNEKELADFDIFPGGMMTLMVVEPPNNPEVIIDYSQF